FAAKPFFRVRTRRLALISQLPQGLTSVNSREMCGKAVFWISLRKNPGRSSLVDLEAFALPRLVGSAGHGDWYHSSGRGSVESHVLLPVVAIHTDDASDCVEAWSRSMLVCQHAFLDIIRGFFV